jgi:pimeloyl-ACP methyl ester carboxylesterase
VSVTDDWYARGAMQRVLDNDVFVVDLPAIGTSDRDEAVLVLHGFPTSSFDWRASVDTLRAHRRVVLFDMLGYGFSDKPDVAYRLASQADIAEAIAQSLGLTNVALVTHDMGDSVGGEILARALDGSLSFAVTRRILTNGSIYIGMAQLTDGQKLLSALDDESLPEGSGIDVDAMATALRATFAPDNVVGNEELRAMAELVVRADGNRRLPRLIRYIHERRVHERRWTGAIETHPAPLTVIWGDLDPIAVYPMVEQLRSVRTDASVHRLDGVGHYPMVEAPDRFNAALASGLD